MNTTKILTQSELRNYLNNKWFITNAIYYELVFITADGHPAIINAVRSAIPYGDIISGYYINRDLKEVPFSFNTEYLHLSQDNCNIISGLVTEVPYLYHLKNVFNPYYIRVVVDQWHPKYGEPTPQWILDHYDCRRVKNG